MAAEVKGLEDEEKLFDFSGRIGKLFLKVHAKGTHAHIEYNVKSDHAFKEEYRAEWQAILCTIFIIGKFIQRRRSASTPRKGSSWTLEAWWKPSAYTTTENVLSDWGRYTLRSV